MSSEEPLSEAQRQHMARAVKQARFAMLAAYAKMGSLKPNLRMSCISAAAIAAAILKKYDLPYRVVAGYVTTPGHKIATPHVWLHTPGAQFDTGITDLAALDEMKQPPLLGMFSFQFVEGSKACQYHEGPKVPEGYEENKKSMAAVVLASHAANFDMYFYRGSDALRQARDQVMEYATRTATEKMAEYDRMAREKQRGGSGGGDSSSGDSSGGGGEGGAAVPPPPPTEEQPRFSEFPPDDF
jgi:hypothetical protein